VVSVFGGRERKRERKVTQEDLRESKVWKDGRQEGEGEGNGEVE